MKKQIAYLSIMLLLSATGIKTDNIIHNETGKYGQPKDISIYTKDERKWQNLSSNQAKTVKVVGDWDIVAWSIKDEPNCKKSAEADSVIKTTSSSQLYLYMDKLYNKGRAEKTYIAKIFKPKDTYIYHYDKEYVNLGNKQQSSIVSSNCINSRSEYLTWTWTGFLNAPVGTGNLTPKEIKKEDIEIEMQKIEKELKLK